jgi:hypothetical protein
MPYYGLLVKEYENPEKKGDRGTSDFGDEVSKYLKKGYTCVGAPFKENIIRDKEVEEYASPTLTSSSTFKTKRGVNHTIWYQALENKNLNFDDDNSAEPNSAKPNSAEPKSAENAGTPRRQRKTLRKRK